MHEHCRAGLLVLLGAREMNLELIWAAVGLLGAVLVGVIAIVWVDRWRKRSAMDAGGPSDELTHYRMLFEQGLLTPEEYERIRRRLEGNRAGTDKAAAQPAGTVSPAASGPPSGPEGPAANSAPAVQNAPPSDNQPGNQAGMP
jgi:hypothetical protein